MLLGPGVLNSYEKGWKYLIRVKDIDSHCGIASGLDLPDQDEFDMPVSLFLTTKQTNEVKNLLKNRNQYKLVSSTMIFGNYSGPPVPEALPTGPRLTGESQ